MRHGCATPVRSGIAPARSRRGRQFITPCRDAEPRRFVTAASRLLALAIAAGGASLAADQAHRGRVGGLGLLMAGMLASGSGGKLGGFAGGCSPRARKQRAAAARISDLCI
jgi:hypothetical protein